MTGTVSVRGADDSEWAVVGGVGSIELGPEDVRIVPFEPAILIAPVDEPLPRTREELLQYRLTSFRDMWREALEPLAKAFAEIAESFDEAAAAMNAAKPAPAKTPPFWAHNPTKQKRPRR